MTQRNISMQHITLEHKPLGNTQMQDTTPAAVLLGVAVSIFRQAPRTISGWLYLLLSIIAAVLFFAPFVLNTAKWASSYYSFLGFMNPDQNSAVEGVIYLLTPIFSLTILHFLYRFFEVTLPNFLERKMNGSPEPIEEEN